MKRALACRSTHCSPLSSSLAVCLQMGSREDLDDDDDFSELYKEYTGPLGSNANKADDKATTNKMSHAASDEEQEERDPNAVPTDFTSREAKVWEAKSKATERNWKKRKEEEMICKICGEPGHFTQGCPSTLGASRKSQDFFERVPARESHVKALFTEQVVSQIEKDIGCKIKIEEKFIIVSGKDRLILRKGVDAVRNVKEEGEKKGSSTSRISRSHSPERRSPGNSRFGRSDSQKSNPRSPERRSPINCRFGRSDSQKSNPSPQGASQFQNRYGRNEKAVEDRVHDDLQKLSRASLQARAYSNERARGRSSHSRSPGRPSFAGNSYNSYNGHSHGRGSYRIDGSNADRRSSEMQPSWQFEYNPFSHTLEELELECKREAMDLARIHDKEEAEENHKHREATKDIRENYMKKLAALRETHAKQWEEFLQVDAQRRQQEVRHHASTSGFGGYKQSHYPEYEHLSRNAHYSDTNFQMESKGRYPNPLENYPSSGPYETYGDFHHPRPDDFANAYGRY